MEGMAIDRSPISLLGENVLTSSYYSWETQDANELLKLDKVR
jgi:hypothetical protein